MTPRAWTCCGRPQLMLKDLRLVMQLASATHVPAPMAQAVAQLYRVVRRPVTGGPGVEGAVTHRCRSLQAAAWGCSWYDQGIGAEAPSAGAPPPPHAMRPHAMYHMPCACAPRSSTQRPTAPPWTSARSISMCTRPSRGLEALLHAASVAQHGPLHSSAAGRARGACLAGPLLHLAPAVAACAAQSARARCVYRAAAPRRRQPPCNIWRPLPGARWGQRGARRRRRARAIKRRMLTARAVWLHKRRCGRVWQSCGVGLRVHVAAQRAG